MTGEERVAQTLVLLKLALDNNYEEFAARTADLTYEDLVEVTTVTVGLFCYLYGFLTQDPMMLFQDIAEQLRLMTEADDDL